jgi:uncharacterized protein (DUF58 family)
MKFVLSERAFILPLIAGAILLFRNWIPAAPGISLVLNSIALAAVALDYFSLPGPDAFSIERLLPEHLPLRRPAKIAVRIGYTVRIPIRAQWLDIPPESFKYDPNPVPLRFKRGGGELMLEYEVMPRRRGTFEFEKCGMRLSTPLGLARRQFSILSRDRIDVLPPVPDEREGLQSRFYTAALATRTLKTYGPGTEFHQMREYRRGDDIRSIHWKRSARTGKLIARDFEPEKGQNVFIMVDGGRLMMAETAGMSKVDWALSSALSLSREALRRKDSVGILGFSNKVDSYILPSNKKPQLPAVVRTIYGFQPQFLEPDYRAAFQWTYSTLKHRCIIVVYTDFVDPYLSAELAANVRFIRRKHRVICCAMGNAVLKKQGYSMADKVEDAVYAAVVREGLDDRTRALQSLARAGVDIVDVEPDALSAEVLNTYARVRWGR